MPNPFGQTRYVVSQPYGPRDDKDSVEPPFRGYPHYHMGIDLVASPWNAAVYSICAGTIFAAGQDTDGANYVIVFDGGDKYVAYWHLSAIAVKRGQAVTTGTQLGNQGYTGNVEPKGPGGAHLHLEIQQKSPYGASLHSPNNCIDPTPYLDAQGGASNDMDPKQIAHDINIKLGCGWPPDIEQQKADFMQMAGNAQQVIEDGLQAGIDKNEIANVWALTNYDEARNGDNPGQFAADRWAGGDNFPTVIKRDMPNYIQAAKAGDQAASQVMALQGQLDNADKLIDATKQELDTAKSQNLNLQGQLSKVQEALQACQQATPPSQAANCQQQADEAVQVALEKAEANPWPLVVTWIAAHLKIGGGK